MYDIVPHCKYKVTQSETVTQYFASITMEPRIELPKYGHPSEDIVGWHPQKLISTKCGFPGCVLANSEVAMLMAAI